MICYYYCFFLNDDVGLFLWSWSLTALGLIDCELSIYKVILIIITLIISIRTTLERFGPLRTTNGSACVLVLGNQV